MVGLLIIYLHIKRFSVSESSGEVEPEGGVRKSMDSNIKPENGTPSALKLDSKNVVPLKPEVESGELAKSPRQTVTPLKPFDYKIGIEDPDGLKVAKIYAKMQGYVVYRTDASIRIDIDDDHKKCLEYIFNHHRIGVDLAKIYSLLPEKLSHSESINRLIGRAITTNASGNLDAAKSILSQAEERLIKLKTIRGRLWYTLSAFALVFCIFLSSLFFGFERAPLLVNMALCGGLGGVMSIAIGFSSLEIDLDASTSVNCLIGCSRILIAMTAAIFSYFAIKSDVAFSFVSKAPDNSGFFMIAMVSGFAEMLVPNIMSNLVKEGSNNQVGASEKKDERKEKEKGASGIDTETSA